MVLDYVKLYRQVQHENTLLQQKIDQQNKMMGQQDSIISQQHSLIEHQRNEMLRQQKRITELEGQGSHHYEPPAPSTKGSENTINFGNDIITYRVTRSHKRKTTEIRVNFDGVEIKVPAGLPDSEIRKIISRKKNWILKSQQKFTELRRRNSPDTRNPKELAHVETKTWEMASKMGVRPSEVIFKHLKSRWGSCDESGVITLNLALLDAPERIIDYVIIHELCHLKIPDHSPQFWNMVYKYDHEFEDKRRWLGHEGLLLLPQNRTGDVDG